jgi:hypothetical protein
MVRYDLIESGFPKNIFSTLNRKIGQFKTRYHHIKVGITGQYPESRFSQHVRDAKYPWKRMVVIYYTSSQNFANTLENWLVDHHWEYLTNEKAGGGSNLSSIDGYCYVYLLIG